MNRSGAMKVAPDFVPGRSFEAQDSPFETQDFARTSAANIVCVLVIASEAWQSQIATSLPLLAMTRIIVHIIPAKAGIHLLVPAGAVLLRISSGHSPDKHGQIYPHTLAGQAHLPRPEHLRRGA